jgi:hypothetical protein
MLGLLEKIRKCGRNEECCGKRFTKSPPKGGLGFMISAISAIRIASDTWDGA